MVGAVGMLQTPATNLKVYRPGTGARPFVFAIPTAGQHPVYPRFAGKTPWYTKPVRISCFYWDCQAEAMKL